MMLPLLSKAMLDTILVPFFILGCMVVKIVIRIVKSHDFTIPPHQKV